jgi:hypothetical protein
VSATGTRSSWNKYDEPYAGQGAAAASEYGYTAGKITSTGVGRGGQSETTIAYGAVILASSITTR